MNTKYLLKTLSIRELKAWRKLLLYRVVELPLSEPRYHHYKRELDRVNLRLNELCHTTKYVPR